MADYSIEVAVPNTGPVGPQGPPGLAALTRKHFVEETNEHLSDFGTNSELSAANTFIHSGGTLPFTYNSNCWLPPSQIDFSGVALQNNNGALVTNRHLLCAKHYTPKIGSSVSFLKPDNTVVSSAVSKQFPLGIKVTTLKVVAVANDTLLLDGIWNNAAAVAIQKTGQTAVAMYYVNDYFSNEVSNSTNVVSLYSADVASDELATQITGLDSSYVGATVIFYNVYDLVLVELEDTISGCAVYPLFDPEYSKKLQDTNDELEVYGVMMLRLGNNGRRAIPKRVAINNSLNATLFSGSGLYNNVLTVSEDIPSFNSSLSAPLQSGDSGSPLFVLDKNNQLILLGIASQQSPILHNCVSPYVNELKKLLAYLYNPTLPYTDANVTYKIQTLPRVIENENKLISSESVDDFANAAAIVAKTVSGVLRSPNFVTNQGTLISFNCGTGAPSASAPNGSFYLRTDGTADTTLYVRAGGAWTSLTSS
jgi:hypothetical protein